MYVKYLSCLFLVKSFLSKKVINRLEWIMKFYFISGIYIENNNVLFSHKKNNVLLTYNLREWKVTF